MDDAKCPVGTSNTNDLKNTSLLGAEPTSLSSLIVWNISKALEESPELNIKEAVTSAQSQLESVCDAEEIQAIVSRSPYERHLACALLAWQQLGHSDADSLCRFVENKRKKLIHERPSKLQQNCVSESRTSKASKIKTKVPPDIHPPSYDRQKSNYEEASDFTSICSISMGPVVKLPLEPQVVMRLDNNSRCQGRKCGQSQPKGKSSEQDTMKKIDKACCLDSECVKRLTAMDATTAELRARAAQLARREAERVELLERAEAAWKDLELGYQRRLALAHEKEEDVARQITIMLEEREAYKNACTTLAKDLRARSDRGEKERVALIELEKLVCDRACQRMKLSQEAARGETLLAEQTCKTTQLDRDLQFKEETARRNMLTLQGEVAAVRALTCEIERATRAELNALRDQIAEVSNNLLEEDAINEKKKAELEDLRKEKMEIIEDLEGCKGVCDEKMKVLINELNEKREQLAKLQEKVMDCKCKWPVTVAVEAKRTPSLAALCKCTLEDKLVECCSCTSMRTQLLSNLFDDLFSGLKNEMKGAVTLMPCQLLKCLEDKHNWDKASIVKTNLKNFFSKLLVGELDIAIATSIENYHAKWVGITCADARSKMVPCVGDDTESEGWQERAIERRAKKLATKLAEELFQERAEKLTQRAQDLINAGPPPCECDTRVPWETIIPKGHAMNTNKYYDLVNDFTRNGFTVSVYAVEVGARAKIPEGCTCTKAQRKQSRTSCDPASATPWVVVGENVPANSCCTMAPPAPDKHHSKTQVYWQQTMEDVMQFQLQDLKTGSVRQNDMRTMTAYENIINLSPSQWTLEEAQLIEVIGPPERDFNVEVERKCEKKSHGKVATHGGASKKYTGAVKNVPESPPLVAPHSWRQAMNDVTMLRYQIEELKKDAIKKGDLKMMEDKIAKLIQRASGGAVPNNPKPKYNTSGNVVMGTNEAYKYSKINRATNAENGKPNTSKKKMLGSVAKEIKAKPIRKPNPAYAVNMCLCSTKRQQQKDLNARRKLGTSLWKQKDTISEISSCVKQCKPVNETFIVSQDSPLSYSLDYDEISCPSNGICFHKIPSNKSIDKLLETLAKWKCDLDVSFTEKRSQKSPCCMHDNCITFNSKTSLKSKENSQERPEQKSNIFNTPGSIHKKSIGPSNTTLLKKNGTKSLGPTTTESVYMGAVNLDKSLEEICKCDTNKLINITPFKCIASSKCKSENKIEDKKTEVSTKHTKKDEHKESSVIQTNQEDRRKDDQTLLNNTSNESKVNTPDLQDVNIINDKKIDVQAVKSSDYQINFLGVTLVDVNPKTKQQLLLENNYNNYKNMRDLNNDDLFCKKYLLDNKERKDNQQVEQNKKDGLLKLAKPVPKLANYIDSMDKKDIHILLLDNDKIITNDIKQKDIGKTYVESIHQAKENEDQQKSFNKHTMILSCDEGTNLSQLHEIVKCKNSSMCYKTASDQNSSNMSYDPDQFIKFDREVKPNSKNSHESDISKKSFKTACESNQLFDKTTFETNELIVDSQEKHIKGSSNVNMKTTQDLRKISCKCSRILDEFKKFLNNNLAKHTENEDVALDVPSLKHFKEQDESCVCCSKLNNEECRDLEQNTFHLIEEYLKKKLNELKLSGCHSFCIPSEEEEKIFDIIVKRVKRLISESTNEIACKCSAKEIKSQGSWNRAYGMLQEYLKIKIKKIQCSCLLAEDNHDTILPDVLEKISNLIEYDFQRLKNICINDSSVQGNKDTIVKQVNFEAKMTENDNDVELHKNFSNFSPLDDKISLSTYHAIQVSYVKQTKQSQLPPNSAMKDESNHKNCSVHSLNKNENCESDLTSSAVELFSKNKDMKKDCLVCKSIEKTCKAAKENQINDKVNESESHFFSAIDTLDSLGSRVEEKQSSSCNNHDHLNHCMQNDEEKEQKQQQGKSKPSSSIVPYLGYTITCSCDDTLGRCICPKNISNADPGIINDLWKKSKPDATYYEKISYILPKQSIQNVSPNMNLETHNEDNQLNNIKKNTANNNLQTVSTCCADSETMILKTSVCDVVKAHIEINTSKDFASVDTDCPNNSIYDHSKQTDCDHPLIKSIYYPAPIEDFDMGKDDTITNEQNLEKLRKHVCHCEKVPICHVKMLVDSIETKLANANCTCDSLLAKVCPVHSTLC